MWFGTCGTRQIGRRHRWQIFEFPGPQSCRTRHPALKKLGIFEFPGPQFYRTRHPALKKMGIFEFPGPQSCRTRHPDLKKNLVMK